MVGFSNLSPVTILFTLVHLLSAGVKASPVSPSPSPATSGAVGIIAPAPSPTTSGAVGIIAPAPSPTTSEAVGIVTGPSPTSAAPAPPSYSSVARNASLDVPYCISNQQDVFMYFAVLIPNWQSSFDFDTNNNDLRGSLSGNSDCMAYTGYDAVPVGEYGTTLAAGFTVPSICTDWEMTQVIKATTGNAQDTPCNSQGNDVGGPDISDVFGSGDPSAA